MVVAVAAVIIGVSGALAPQAAPTDPQDDADAFVAPGSDAVVQERERIADDVVMTLGGSADTYVLRGEEYLEAGCHAVDLKEGDISETVIIGGAPDTAMPGDYTVTYTATTADGAVARAERRVHVVDSFEESATSLPVLMYHYVYAQDDQPSDLNGNYLLDAKLEEQLRYLSENDYYYPSFQEVKAFAEGTHTLPARSVVLTFDDCEAGFLKYGVPLLNEYRVPATSFVICSDGDAAQKVHENATPYVQFQSHSYAMHQAGSNVGRGGRIHAMSQQEIVEDLQAAQSLLGTTEAFAYPFGDNNATAQAALLDAGVLCAFTIDNDRVHPGDDPTALSRVRISGEYSIESFKYLVEPNV